MPRRHHSPSCVAGPKFAPQANCTLLDECHKSRPAGKHGEEHQQIDGYQHHGHGYMRRSLIKQILERKHDRWTRFR